MFLTEQAPSVRGVVDSNASLQPEILQVLSTFTVKKLLVVYFIIKYAEGIYHRMNPKPSSLDFYAFIQNYGETISGSFIKKVYQIAETDFLFQLYNSSVGKRYLLVSLKKGLVFYEAERPEDATPLSMLLRKSLSERRIVGIRQINFDRVVKINLHTGQEIILELFREGNFIITNNGLIEFATDLREWKNRKIMKGEPYSPPSANDPLALDRDGFAKVFSASKASIVQTLATRLNLGGDMAEEILFRATLDKDIPAKESLANIEAIRNGIQDILSESKENKSYYYRDQNIVSPVQMTHINVHPDITYPDLNSGLLDYVTSHFPSEEEKDPIAKRLDSMKKSIEEFEKQRDLSFRRGNLIMQNLPLYENMIRKLNKIRMQRDLNTVKEFEGYTVTSYKAATREMSFVIDETEVILDLNLSAGQNANQYFQKAKDFKSKIEGAFKAIEDTKKRNVPSAVSTKKKRKKEWFENYHWFISSEGFLVIAGRDAKSNEKVVKKHLKDHDLYVHADVYGAPSTIIKVDGETKPGDSTIYEACAFSVAFSRAWPAGIRSGSAYWVLPSQVSKTPESGEFVSTGAWIVRGKRNYLFDLPIKLGIVMKDYKGNVIPMIFPVTESSSLSDNTVIITPGDEKRTLIAQQVSKILGIDREEVESILPPGNSQILSRD